MQIPNGSDPVAMVLVPDKAPVEVFRLKIDTVSLKQEA
jgi:hypothetical protein